MAGETESHYPWDWVHIAGEDLRRVRRRLAEGDTDDASFHLQQAIEKYLKAYLLSRGWKLRKTHDLNALINDAVSYDRQLERYRLLCQRVTNYYLVDRYPPFDEEGPSTAEVRRAYTKAKALVQHLQGRRPKGRE